MDARECVSGPRPTRHTGGMAQRGASSVRRRGARRVLAALALVLPLAACGRIGFDAVDAGAPDLVTADAQVPDGGPDAGHDAGSDAGADAGTYDPCTQLPALRTAPVLDGTLDPGVVLVPITPVGWTHPPMMAPAEIHARAGFGWRSDGLYVYIEVDDPDRHPAAMPLESWCGDGIEIYADDDGNYATASAYDDPGTIQLIAAAPSTAAGTSTFGQFYVFMGPTGTWPGARFVMVGRPGGYAIETYVRASELRRTSWALSSGRHVGLDLSINVSTPDGSTTTGASDCGMRLGQYFMHVVPASGGSCGQPYCDTRAFCRPVLLP